MGFGDSPKSPSFKQDRRGWNAAWERDLATVYGSGVEFVPPTRRPIPNLTTGLPPAIYDMMLQESNITIMERMTEQILVLQRDLTRKAAQRFAEDNFESAWMARSVKQREDFILEGLVRACEASPDFEDHRKWCPELTLKRLNHGSGKGYIDLLKELCHQDTDKVPDNFKTPPNAIFDKLTGFDKEQFMEDGEVGPMVMSKVFQTQRTYLLTMVVWNILLAYYGESETYGLEKGQRATSDEKKRFKEVFEDHLDPESIKSVIDEVATNRRDERAQHHCTSCSLPAERAGVARLSACQRCKAIDRMVYYCSKECQTTDWKSGKPPHKTICGKRGAVTDAFLSSRPSAPDDKDDDEEDDDFPGPPAPGYIRTPALLHQLKLLKENPSLSYVLVQPHPHPDHGVMLPHAMGKMMFMLCFERAACEGEPDKVLMMYNMLEESARNAPGFGVKKLKEQLWKEYGVDVDAVKTAAGK